MKIHVEQSEPILVHCAPVNEATRYWGVYAIPCMERIPTGELIIRINGEQDCGITEVRLQAPTLYYVSKDNGETWKELDGEKGNELWNQRMNTMNSSYIGLQSGKTISFHFYQRNFKFAGIPYMKEFQGPTKDVKYRTYKYGDLPEHAKELFIETIDPVTKEKELSCVEFLFKDMELLSGFSYIYDDGWRSEDFQFDDGWRSVEEGHVYLMACSVVELADGTLLMFTQGQHPDVHDRLYGQVYCLSSVNGGKTWNLRSSVSEYSEVYKYGLTEEMSAIITKDGCIRLVVRTDFAIDPAVESPNVDLVYIESQDNGFTWSKPVSVSDSSVTPHLVELENDILVAIYGRPGVHFKYSCDKAETWSRSYSIIGPTLEEARAAGQSDRDSKYFNSSSYSNTYVEKLDDNTILVLYNDMKYDNGDGQEHKATLVRKIKVTAVDE